MTPLERFNALPARQRDEILDNHRHYNTEHRDWWDYVYDHFKEDMDAAIALVREEYRLKKMTPIVGYL